MPARHWHRLCTIHLLLLLAACAGGETQAPPDAPRWLAGDHHVHSRFSVGYDRSTDPPRPVIGGDAIYPIPMNVLMARFYGLSWMVTTDHGGPNHSKIDLEIAYPELQQSRAALPDMVQFFGMELNSPGADHASLIMPRTDDEARRLHQLESAFDKYGAWPIDPARDQPGKMIEALRQMQELPDKPVVIANHPSRSAKGLGDYGLDDPAELRGWNDAAPDVAVGMAGAPGHQAASLSPPPLARGNYRGFPTLGGFDQMTARLGGFWDSMLGEGRHWWITANSDSHVHYTEGGKDFWPGEYSKTYVLARKNNADILAALRSGKIFVTTGDLISELYVDVSFQRHAADIGGTLTVPTAATVAIRIRVRDPDGHNHHGDNPVVRRVDLIVGNVDSEPVDPATDTNPSTRALKRFSEQDWQRDGEFLTMTTTLDVTRPMYVRVRGTSTTELEPAQDHISEDPWQDLWFYSNPVFIDLR